MNTTRNDTDLSHAFFEDSPSHLAFNIICILVYIAIIIVAAVGNFLVCTAFLMSQMLRRSPTNYFIFSLALSDLITATMCVPFDVNQTLTNWRWDHGSFVCSFWTTVYLIAVPSSILSLLAVSVDRYKALSDPLNRFRQTRFMTRKRACIIIAVLWIYSLVFAITPELGWNLYPENVMNGMCYFNTPPKYSILNSTLNFIVPVVIMCVLYMRIYRIARTLKSTPRLIEDYSFSESTNEAQRRRVQSCIRKRIKTTKNILLVVCTFFFCWMPYTSFSLISIFCRECYNNAPPELSTILLIFGYSNSALNPYLYAFRNRKFKDTFAKLRSRIRLTRNRQSSRRSQTQPTVPTNLSESHMDFQAVYKNSIQA